MSPNRDYDFEPDPDPAPKRLLAPGALGIPRNRLLTAGAIVVALLIAAAGVFAGMHRSGGRHGELPEDGGMTIETAKSRTVPAAAATPLSLPVGEEPGSAPMSEPTSAAVQRPDAPLIGPGSAPVIVDDSGHGVSDADSEPSGPQSAAPPASPQAAMGGQFAAASFSCANARSRAEAIVCADPRLSDADRRLRRAYQQAMAETDDPGALAAEQASWRDARERAAEHDDPEGIAELYAQRLQELEPR